MSIALSVERVMTMRVERVGALYGGRQQHASGSDHIQHERVSRHQRPRAAITD